MDAGAIATLVFIVTLGACIMLPVYLRNLLYRQTLDTVAKAIEHGIDPERIAVQLPSIQRERDDDPNGNWKAGVVLISIALGFFLAISVPVWLLVGSGHLQERFTVLAPPLILGIVGAALIIIHRRIVGAVVPYSRKRSRDGGEMVSAATPSPASPAPASQGQL